MPGQQRSDSTSKLKSWISTAAGVLGGLAAIGYPIVSDYLELREEVALLRATKADKEEVTENVDALWKASFSHNGDLGQIFAILKTTPVRFFAPPEATVPGPVVRESAENALEPEPGIEAYQTHVKSLPVGGL